MSQNKYIVENINPVFHVTCQYQLTNKYIIEKITILLVIADFLNKYNMPKLNITNISSFVKSIWLNNSILNLSKTIKLKIIISILFCAISYKNFQIHNESTFQIKFDLWTTAV